MTTNRRQNRSRPSRLSAGLAICLSLALAGAGPALGQSDPTAAQYGSAVEQITGATGGGGGGSGETSTPAPEPAPSGLQKKVVGGLPFTGLDMIALAAVALALTSMGFALRRMTAQRRAH